MKTQIFSSPNSTLDLKARLIVIFVATALSACGGSGSSDVDSTTETSSTSTTATASTNTTPIANAGADILVNLGTTVALDGSASSDADQDSLSYLWVLETTPDGSSAELEAPTSVNPSFAADVAGSYSITLTVSDGELDSEPDTVMITASMDNMDITDIEFTNRSGDCRDYVGSYYANVTDVQRAQTFDGDVVITEMDTHCVISSNEIPNHDFNDTGHFATNVSAQNSQIEIPISPTMTATATEIDMQVTNVMFLNGATVDLLAAACYDVGNEPLGNEKIGCGPDQIDNPWRYDPMSPLNNFGTDSHNAHTQPDGTYHYHGNPLAMYDQDCEATGVASPVIGFAADGFPVYGPCFADDSGVVAKAQPSYQLKDNGGPRQNVLGYTTPEAGQGVIASDNYDGQFRGDYEYIADSGDLDECNGRIVDGQYGYYITDAYPWVLACYQGEPDDSFRKNAQQLTNTMHVHEDGTVHTHE